MSSTTPDLLDGSAPTMVDLPPPPVAAANDNIAAALSNNNTTNNVSAATTNNNNSKNNNNNNNSNFSANVDYSGAWNLMGGILKGKDNTTNNNSNSSNKVKLSSPTSSSVSSNLKDNVFLSSLSTHTTATLSNLTKTLTNTVTGRNTLPDKTTASQVLMFRQLLHTSCRPGLRLSRGYEGTPAQRAVLHMPWWERGIERSGRMVISYDNLITRLWISGAILPFDRRWNEEEENEEEENEEVDDNALIAKLNTSPEKERPHRRGIDTLVNDKGLPPIPHKWWIDRLGFQQDDPVTDFRSGGVLSLAMLVHIVESCPSVHARFVPKAPLSSSSSSSSTSLLQSSQSIEQDQKELLTSLEEIIHEDASVLPFGITCINITDMLAKFLLFSKSIDKMDALLSAKPFWKMFLDPNAMLVLQEVSLDLLCDVCVEIGRERRLRNLLENDSLVKDKMNKDAVGMHDRRGKITVFDFTEIMERTEKRVGDEVLGAGPRNVDELRAVARRVKSKYLMRIQLKEKHLEKRRREGGGGGEKQQVMNPIINESMKTVVGGVGTVVGGVGTVVGGVGGFVNRFRGSSNLNVSVSAAAAPSETSNDNDDTSGPGVPSTPTEEVTFDGNNDNDTTATTTSVFGIASPSCGACLIDLSDTDEANDGVLVEGNKSSSDQDLLSFNQPPVLAESPVEAAAEASKDDNNSPVTDLSGALSEAFDLLGDGDFTADDLDAMDVKVGGSSAFTIDDL